MEVWRGLSAVNTMGACLAALLAAAALALGVPRSPVGGRSSQPQMHPLLYCLLSESAAEESPMSADSAAGIDGSIAANIRGDAVKL